MCVAPALDALRVFWNEHVYVPLGAMLPYGFVGLEGLLQVPSPLRLPNTLSMRLASVTGKVALFVTTTL
jgi:hypothetical protein